MREILLFNLISLLQKQGFRVTSFLHSNTCFDLAAKKSDNCLLIKVFENIDAFRPEAAEELKKISVLFKAIPIILGEKSKAFSLQKGLIYERYGLNVVSIKTFTQLLNESIPWIKYFKGKNIVELDKDKLRDEREKMHLTLNELSEKIGVAKESIYRFEQGNSTSIETGKKLEKELKCNLIKQFNLFDAQTVPINFNEEIELSDSAFERLQDIGLKLTFFEHAPFNAANSIEEDLLISKSSKQGLKKKVLELEKSKQLFNSHSMILTSNPVAKKVIESTPIIEEEELYSLSKPKDLINLVKEREKQLFKKKLTKN